MSKISETFKSEVVVDMISGLRINLDINVKISLRASKVQSFTVTMNEADSENLVQLFELNYHDQIFALKEVGRILRSYQEDIDTTEFTKELKKTEKSLRY